MYDVFFISYDETNAEENWQQVLKYHPKAIRVHAIGSISDSHMLCNQRASTDYFWTIDGDNWLLGPLPDITMPVADLMMFDAIDPVDGSKSSIGAIKLWKRDSFTNTDMSKGDFCKFATSSMRLAHNTLSEHRYNASPYEAWRKTFRHMVKCFSGIIPSHSLQQNIDKAERFRDIDEWCYKGYLDAKNYVEECEGDFALINRINDYDWLRIKFSNNK